MAAASRGGGVAMTALVALVLLAGPKVSDREVTAVIAQTDLVDVSVSWSAVDSERWVSFGAPDQRSLCTDGSNGGGCVRLGPHEAEKDVFNDLLRRLKAHDVAPVPEAARAVMSVLAAAAANSLGVTFGPLALAPGHALKIAGADESGALSLGARVYVGQAHRLALPNSHGGWDFAKEPIDDWVYAAGLVTVQRENVLVLVTGNESGSVGGASGTGTLYAVATSEERGLAVWARKPIAVWFANKGWETSGPHSQFWLWPTVVKDRIRLAPAPKAPTTWLQRGTKPGVFKSLDVDVSALAHEAGDWCWGDGALIRCGR